MSKTIKILLVVLSILGLLAYVGYQYVQKTMIQPVYVDLPDLKGELIQESLTTPDGHLRTYEFYKPAMAKDTTTIIYALHGSTSSGPDMRKQFAYEWDRLADEYGFIVVYPTGFDNHWNDCRGSADYQANIQNIDDLTFLRLMEKEISDKVNTTIDRRFATGFSNGGHFCFKLALEAPDWINGIAAISANLPIEENRDCGAANLFVPTMLVNGTDDWINPYEGGLVSIRGNDSRGTVHSSNETIKYFMSLDSCAPRPTAVILKDINTSDESTIKSYTWRCDGSMAKGKLFQVNNGGHTLPHPVNQLVPILGNTNRDVVLAEEIWKFFEGI